MQRIDIVRESGIDRSPRVRQLEGMFDLQGAEISRFELHAEIDLPDEWNVGLIVGPSGCGKTTVAKELFGDEHVFEFDSRSVIDNFPESMSIKEITTLLGSVGFNSPPNWLRPFDVLSNGEKFRVEIARALAETNTEKPVLVDEFTSVVDRQVAKVASHCVQKSVRRRGTQFVAVACHYDIIDWLQPDWIFEPATGEFTRRSLRRRPEINIEIRTANWEVWPYFAGHHYLSASLNKCSQCLVLLVEGKLAAFYSHINFPHPKRRNIRMGHRLVVLPDYQGLGLAEVLVNFTGQYLYERGFELRAVTAHPAMIAARSKSPRWRLTHSRTSMRQHGWISADEKDDPARMRYLSRFQRRIGEKNSEDWEGRVSKGYGEGSADLRTLTTHAFVYVPPKSHKKAGE